MKRIVVIGLVLLVLFGSCASLTGSGNDDYQKANKLFEDARERMAKFGENDAKTLQLFAQSVEYYKKCTLVDNKNTRAANQMLGEILSTFGPRSMWNYEEAIKYLYEALAVLEKDNDDTYGSLARCYRDVGNVLYRMGDFTSAYENYQAAAKLRDIYAGLEALMYWLGLGTEQDLPKAMEKYRTASLAGIDLWANIYALEYHINEIRKGSYYSEPMDLFLAHLHSKGMGEEKSKWMPLLTRSADLGCPPAQVDLWVTYRDNNEAARGMPYLQKAFDAEFVPAYFHMGYVYQVGLNNTKKDPIAAAKWYEKAAVEGFPVAQSNLGVLYYNNMIKAPQGFNNQQMSYYWWNAAAEQGLGIAKQNLTLVANYKPPMDIFDAVILILNTVQTSIDSYTEVYSKLNKPRIVSYVPPNNSSQQPQQSGSSSTVTRETVSSSTSGDLCPLCSGTKKCDNQGWGLAFCRGGYMECSTCSGDGIYDKKVCTTCKGKKQVECGVCHGTGICQRCKGAGVI